MNFVARTAQREKSALLEERPWGAIGAVLRTFRSARQEAASLEAKALRMTLMETVDHSYQLSVEVFGHSANTIHFRLCKQLYELAQAVF